MNSDMLWIVLLTMTASPALAADASPGTSYSDKVQKADGSGPAANAEASVQRGARKTGHAVKQGARRTGHAVGQGLQKTGRAIDRAGEKLEGRSE